jgi:protein-tyrosine phosphatase
MNWVPVGGGFLALGHRPRLKELPKLKTAGCNIVLTLLSEREEAKIVGKAISDAGLEWIWFPLEHGDPPKESRRPAVRALFERLRAQLAEGQRIFVHCSAGIHRTGMISYALMRFLGMSADDARRTLSELRGVTAEGVGDARLKWGDDWW